MRCSPRSMMAPQRWVLSVFTLVGTRPRACNRRMAPAGGCRCDIVVIAGKVHGGYQRVGRKRLDFDDRVVVREIAAEIGAPGRSLTELKFYCRCG